MYIPAHYQNEDLSEVRQFIIQNAFGILVNQVDGKPWATHLPLEFEKDDDGRDCLVGHIAKANRQWKSFRDGGTVLCIFNGPHAYVSSSWYKEEEVPTWNYIAVHVYGSLHMQSEQELLSSLTALVDKYEKDSKKPVTMQGLSRKTMRQVKGIVGFRIVINEVQAAYKLSQGREHDHPEIIAELKATKNAGAKGIVKAMSKGRVGEITD